MTDLNNEVFELAIEELDQVTGGADLLTAFLTGFAKGLGEPLPSQPTPPAPTPPVPPSGGGGGTYSAHGSGVYLF